MLDSEAGIVVGSGQEVGGNETDSHLAAPRTPTRTTLGFFEAEKRVLDKERVLKLIGTMLSRPFHNSLGMRILVGCEFSGTVRDCFLAMGHDAISCDLLPTEARGPHIQGDVLDALYDGGVWDLVILHPPFCTYLASSGLHWNNKLKVELKKQKKHLDSSHNSGKPR